MNKRILILTAGFGEGHNSAARGVRDGLARVAPEQTEVELHDLFAETYPLLNELVRRSYLWVVDFAPQFCGPGECRCKKLKYSDFPLVRSLRIPRKIDNSLRPIPNAESST